MELKNHKRAPMCGPFLLPVFKQKTFSFSLNQPHMLKKISVKIGIEKAIVHSALNEPFLKTFGSERNYRLTEKLGMKRKKEVGIQ